MKYDIEMTINAPRDKVLALFLNPDHLKSWQKSLINFELLKGDGFRGVGSMSKQLHRMGNREVEMIATVTVDNHPDEFAAVFEADGVWNEVTNRFTQNEEGTTDWFLTSDFRCKGFFMKAMLTLFPGMFKKQTREFMEDFKAFAESHETV